GCWAPARPRDADSSICRSPSRHTLDGHERGNGFLLELEQPRRLADRPHSGNAGLMPLLKGHGIDPATRRGTDGAHASAGSREEIWQRGGGPGGGGPSERLPASALPPGAPRAAPSDLYSAVEPPPRPHRFAR